MTTPYRDEAQSKLETHVKDAYQLFHARMVATAMEGYADIYKQDLLLWYVTGLLHDIDFAEHPDTHPAEALKWFKEWGYPEALTHAVEAHAYNYNGFNTPPQTTLAFALLACDEMSGIVYAYQKVKDAAYSELKESSIKKRFLDKNFAAKIDRGTILSGCEGLGISLDEHIRNMLTFLKNIE